MGMGIGFAFRVSDWRDTGARRAPSELAALVAGECNKLVGKLDNSAYSLLFPLSASGHSRSNR
jgi:hypothetical protein